MAVEDFGSLHLSIPDDETKREVQEEFWRLNLMAEQEFHGMAEKDNRLPTAVRAYAVATLLASLPASCPTRRRVLKVLSYAKEKVWEGAARNVLERHKEEREKEEREKNE